MFPPGWAHQPESGHDSPECQFRWESSRFPSDYPAEKFRKSVDDRDNRGLAIRSLAQPVTKNGATQRRTNCSY